MITLRGPGRQRGSFATAEGEEADGNARPPAAVHLIDEDHVMTQSLSSCHIASQFDSELKFRPDQWSNKDSIEKTLGLSTTLR
jgi:hypothetical protein